MSYVLVIIYGFMGSAVGQDVILEAPSKEACEEAREALLKIPGYYREYVICLPGIKPVVK